MSLPFRARRAPPRTPTAAWKPSKAELLAARTKRVPDLIRPGLRVLFVGINPGLYSAAVGHHFARPGNRFWPTLELSGFTPKCVSAFDERALLELGLGITNIVSRTTATADELSKDELALGATRLSSKIRKFAPRVVAVLGVTAYRAAFACPRASLGRQAEPLAGSIAWILPNPSGLNAHYQLEDLAKQFRELREAADAHV